MGIEVIGEGGDCGWRVEPTMPSANTFLVCHRWRLKTRRQSHIGSGGLK